MNQEKLQYLIDQSFIYDEIDVDKYLNISEKLNNLIESGNLLDYTINRKKIKNSINDGFKRCNSQHGKIAIKPNNREEKASCYIQVIQRTLQLINQFASECDNSNRPELCRSRYDNLERKLINLSHSLRVQKGV